MTTCPDFGALRAWLDDEDPQVSAHIARCGACSETAGALRDDAELAGRALGLLTPPDEPQEPLRPPPGRLRPLAPVAASRARSLPSPRRAGAAAAALLLAALVVGTPGGRAAASAFLDQFRSERFQVVTFDPEDARQGLGELSALGSLSGDFHAEAVEAASLDEAAALTGIRIAAPPTAALPPGLRPEPVIHALQERSLTLTFDAGKAPELPPSLDGASLHVRAPAAVMLVYLSADGAPGLIVGEAEQVTATAEGGPTLEQMRDALLELDTLPAGITDQLRAIDDWRSALPLPLPADSVVWQDVTVGGAPGVAFGDESGLGSAVLWQADGRIHGVGGPLAASEVQRVAEQLAR